MNISALSLREYSVGSRASQLRRAFPVRAIFGTFIWFLVCIALDLALSLDAKDGSNAHLGIIVEAVAWGFLVLFIFIMVGVVEAQRRRSERFVRMLDGDSRRTVFSVFLTDGVRKVLEESKDAPRFSAQLTFVIVDCSADGMRFWRPTSPPTEVLQLPWKAVQSVKCVTDPYGSTYLQLTGDAKSFSLVNAHVADGSLSAKPHTVEALASSIDALRAS